ncbi:group I intron endonuclease [compost metagenome]
MSSQYRGIAAYILFNVVNGFFYVGSSTDLRERLYRHRYQLDNGKHDNYILQRSYTCWEDIEITYYPVSSESKARFIEQDLLRFHRNDPLLANLGTGAYCTWGDGMPDEFKQQIRQSKLGTIISQEARDKISRALKGKPKSPEHIRKAAEAQRGRICTEDMRELLRDRSRKTPVSIDGIVYESRLDAARKLGVGRGTVHGRLQSDNYPTWKYHEV